jgi:hypothetical protein
VQELELKHTDTDEKLAAMDNAATRLFHGAGGPVSLLACIIIKLNQSENICTAEIANRQSKSTVFCD